MSTPKSTGEVITNPYQRQSMVEEMTTLHSNKAWDIVTLPPGKIIAGCRWVYTMKVGLDGHIDCFIARLVAKEYTQMFGLY